MSSSTSLICRHVALPKAIQLLQYPAAHQQRKRNDMGACTCGYTTDPEKNCNGTHKVVQAVKADIADALAANGFPHASEYVKTNKITPKSE